MSQRSPHIPIFEDTRRRGALHPRQVAAIPSINGTAFPAAIDVTVTLPRPTIFTSGWTPRTAALGDFDSSMQFRDVCWSPDLGLWCAVAQSGINKRIQTSPDGINWTAQTASANFQGVCWSPDLGLFCAVGIFANAIHTSPDGVTWTIRTNPTIGGGPHVVWAASLGLFVVVGAAGAAAVMTSPDGINWTARTVPEPFSNWQDVAWSPDLGLLCAVSFDGANRVMTSPDGINWTARTAAAVNGWDSVAWSSPLGLFCAVSSDGTDRVMTSPDGINWTSRTAAAANQWRHVCFGGGYFVAVASSGTGNRAMFSPDGINWTIDSTQDRTWLSVEHSPELMQYVAVAIDGPTGRIMTKP